MISLSLLGSRWSEGPGLSIVVALHWLVVSSELGTESG